MDSSMSTPPPLPPSLAPSDAGGMGSADMGSADMGAASDAGSSADMGAASDMGAAGDMGATRNMSGMGGGETTPMSPMSSTPPGDMPPAGGAMPPPGGYAPPPQQPSGGYMAQSGGPTPPPQGGYTPPPQGGYGAPPPAGGYPPPPQGGYGAPPPPPPGMYAAAGVPAAAPTAQPGIQGLMQSYINAVTKPNVSTYEAELGNASWAKVLIGIAIVAVIGFIVNLIFANTMSAYFDQLQQQLNANGSNFDLTPYRGIASTGAGGALIGPFITFFLGAGWLWLMARLFGGSNSDFLTHSYLLSISYAPMKGLAALLGFIPCVGQIAGLVLPLYQIFSAGLALQASQRMAPARAQWAAWIGLIVLFVGGCVCFVLAIFGLAAAFSNTGR